MKLRTALIAGLVTVAALVVFGMLDIRRAKADATANFELLKSAMSNGVSAPLTTAGTVQIRVDGELRGSAIRVEHSGRRARMTVESEGESVELHDDGRSVWRIDGDERTPMGGSPRAIDWTRLTANYKPRALPGQSIAGRPAIGVSLVSRHTGRQAEVFYLEPDTGLILLRESYRADGPAAMTRSVSSVTQATPIGPWPETEADASVRRSLSDADFAAGAGFAPRRPAWLPDGYAERGLHALKCPRGREYAELRYSDGLRTITIHEHRPRRFTEGPGHGRGLGMGRPDPSEQPVIIGEGLATTVSFRRPDLRIVITADLSADEILRVLDSIPTIG